MRHGPHLPIDPQRFCCFLANENRIDHIEEREKDSDREEPFGNFMTIEGWTSFKIPLRQRKLI